LRAEHCAPLDFPANWNYATTEVDQERMSRIEKLYEHILLRRSDANVSFAALRDLLSNLGFRERIRGDHHIYTMTDVEEIINLQPRGASAKPYQVKQVRAVILKYGLRLKE
jgi:hypothetical protein